MSAIKSNSLLSKKKSNSLGGILYIQSWSYKIGCTCDDLKSHLTCNMDSQKKKKRLVTSSIMINKIIGLFNNLILTIY